MKTTWKFSHLIFYALVLLNSTVYGQLCSLCSDPASLVPNLTLFPGIGPSCGKIEADLNLVSSSGCDEARETTSSDFDYTAFCCSDVNIEDSCLACNGGPIDESATIDPSSNPRGLTCAEAKTILDFSFPNTVTCSNLSIIILDCCAETSAPTASASETPTTTATPTEADPTPQATSTPTVNPTAAPNNAPPGPSSSALIILKPWTNTSFVMMGVIVLISITG